MQTNSHGPNHPFEAQQIYQVNVMKAFLQAGLPLAKLDVFKDIGPKYLHVSAMRDQV